MAWSQSSQGQHDAVTWFTKSQLQAVITDGLVPEWFHGIISRKTAEDLLMQKPPGYFLIRVSESRIGYTLSYRAEGRCRHFMIDPLEDGQYVIVGENRRHRLLQDLVDFHRRTPIMPFSQVLTVACGQSADDSTDYAELLFPHKHPTLNTSLLPNNSPLPSMSHPVSQEDLPPALPHRPHNLSSTVLSANRLHPSLEEECPHISSPLPATPVPMTRKRYTADNPPPGQPPEVPSRRGLPLKQNQACTGTVSAPGSPPSTGASELPLSGKNLEAKLSVVSNLKNLKKKFQRKRSISHDTAYAEIHGMAAGGLPENEYQEIGRERTFSGSALSYAGTNVKLTDEGFPEEYLLPPSFAPGY